MRTKPQAPDPKATCSPTRCHSRWAAGERFSGRRAGQPLANLRGALEEIIAMDRRDPAPRIYFSTLKATSGLLDIRNRWMAAYWRFYLIKQQREDLLGKTARFDAQALDTVPARSLVLANVGDVTADGLVKSGALRTVSLVDEIDRDPFFEILQR